MLNAETLLEIIKRKVESGDLQGAKTTVDQSSLWFPHDVRFMRLNGFVSGLMQHHLDAKNYFLKAFEADGYAPDMVNVITAMLALKESAMAISIIRDGLSLFDDESRYVLAGSCVEAISLGTIKSADLPDEITVLINEINEES